MANKPLISRREFISILAATVAVYPLSSVAINRAENISPQPLKEPWLTLSKVQQHLFPDEENSIGAEDIHALEYLRSTIMTPDFDKEEETLIHNGVNWLNDLSQQQYSKKFIQLDNIAKEKLLRRIESSNAGERWLSTVLTYLLEALLTDPIYGGNTNGIGWKWLQHQAGFPRPPEDKKYYKLDKNRYRKTKA